METSVAEVDRISTETLRDRYGIKSRNTLSLWLNRLGIPRHKEGKNFFVSRNYLDQLDELHAYLKQGLSMEESIKKMDSLGLITQTIALPPQNEALDPSLPANRAIYLQDLVTTLETLTKAANEEWALPTSTLLFLLNRSRLPRSSQKYFSLWGFIFVRSQVRSGKEYQWWVRRQSQSLPSANEWDSSTQHYKELPIDF